MGKTNEMKQRIKEMKDFTAKVNSLLGVRPTMELIITNGKPIDSFDLRSLNQNILKQKS
jgi:hypothetical protein